MEGMLDALPLSQGAQPILKFVTYEMVIDDGKVININFFFLYKIIAIRLINNSQSI